MIQKRLADLNIDELKSEFGKAGILIQGDFTESLALVKLTIYLVSSGEDPFTFLFNIPLEKVAEDRNMNESKFEDEASEDLPSERPVDSGLGSADGVSAGSLNSEILPSTLSSFVMAWESSVTSTAIIKLKKTGKVVLYQYFLLPDLVLVLVVILKSGHWILRWRGQMFGRWISCLFHTIGNGGMCRKLSGQMFETRLRK